MCSPGTGLQRENTAHLPSTENPAGRPGFETSPARPGRQFVNNAQVVGKIPAQSAGAAVSEKILGIGTQRAGTPNDPLGAFVGTGGRKQGKAAAKLRMTWASISAFVRNFP